MGNLGADLANFGAATCAEITSAGGLRKVRNGRIVHGTTYLRHLEHRRHDR